MAASEGETRPVVALAPDPVAVALSVAALVLCGASPVLAEKAGIGWQETISAKAGKAKTMAELAKMYDSSSCIDCHKDTHDDGEK